MKSLVARYQIGKLFLSSVSEEALLDEIAHSIDEKREITVGHANANFVVEAEQNAGFAGAANAYTFLQPDGIGVFWALKILYPSDHRSLQRQNGTDFYYLLMTFAERKRLSIYFLGNEDVVLQALIVVITAEYPHITIAGSHNGFFDMNDSAVAADIAKVRPNIVMVGMGVPRQEIWVDTYRHTLSASVVITVGAGIKYLSGTYPRAPVIMRKLGFEWLYRLFREPNRLWRRYILGNPYFCYLVIRQKIGE